MNWTCPQANLLEALHDDRLGAPERASLERHLRTCAECAKHLYNLQEIREAVRAPVSPLTPLMHQRARLGLLRAAVGEPRRRPLATRRWGVAAGLLVAASAIAGVSVWRSSPFHPPVPAPPATAPEIPAQESTSAGSRAKKSTAAPHAVPVSTPPEPAVPDPVPSSPVPAAEAAKPAHSRPAHVSSKHVDHSTPAPSPEIAVPQAVIPPAGDPRAVSPASRDFAAGIGALGSGDFGVAASRFATFAAAYPTDPRADEAAYLVAISLQRAGREDDAKVAAERYLHDHPRGAHRVQAAKIAGAKPTSAPVAPSL